MQSSDDRINLIVDGVDVTNVTLVGRVSNKTGRITDVTFVLDDGTGRIECSKWLHEAVDTNEAEAILDGMYARLHGQLKHFQRKRTLTVFSFRPVTDFNEIASHFSDCIYVHLYNSRLRSSVPNQQHSSPIPPTIVYQAQAVPPTNQGVTVEAMVLDFLHHPTNSSRNELAIKNLIDEGAVYETIGDHNKSIING
ncbi:hypothetical protein AAZX31_17G060800 [Glycine max]|uniref:OB domain-containing protein n=1 Tax=Glycine max TaxID=3847 RepID=A0A0R0FJ67_SOYBN